MLARLNSNRRAPSTLGESGEDYLEAILILARRGRPVRVKDIARLLNVSRPSVVSALNLLEEKGFIRHEHYGDVELTAAGQNYATAIYQRHLLLKHFLQHILGVSEKVAAEDACRLEHALSPETTRRLTGFVRRLGVK